ncbi:protein-S-isoprenylcysteine O-methyltransferase Ste14 [Microcella alkaliphila]|uniref:Protein-S-isoprenylcysteine O-methyltransferase Ste14 n=1 Tax=Microcella alkaliphila TaxID=279828 RepID=A0A4Q7TNF3_9MICO|nr:isoprenylcysteine carboxylmethyltransferase family protein [Microcella alkaliphila]RZT60862.1 protein-S-isoprenylcysteine O-methyltransferase Ste14 [Microcella alkaliphila]
MARESVHPALAWGLVGAQFVLLIALGFAPRGDLWARTPLVVGIALALVGAGVVVGVAAGITLGRALTPSPIPREGSQLVTAGVYRLVRHPLYSGLVLLGAGLFIIGASWWHAALFVALFVLLSVKARLEERMLAARFPEYTDYASRTGRIVPGVRRLRG